MGMAASQARLLSITSRIADNELRAQIVNNSKMRLAIESSRVSEQYVSALNSATMMMSNYDTAGNSQYQQLSFNALTAYSSHNNQYGLVNANGKILVSENEAKLYKDANGDLEGYLALHNLEYTSKYFTEDTFRDQDGNPASNVQIVGYSAIGEEYTIGTYSLEDLKTIYEGGTTTDGVSHVGYDQALMSDKYLNFSSLYTEYELAKFDLDVKVAADLNASYLGTGWNNALTTAQGSATGANVRAAHTDLNNKLNSLVSAGLLSTGSEFYTSIKSVLDSLTFNSSNQVTQTKTNNAQIKKTIANNGNTDSSGNPLYDHTYTINFGPTTEDSSVNTVYAFIATGTRANQSSNSTTLIDVDGVSYTLAVNTDYLNLQKNVYTEGYEITITSSDSSYPFNITFNEKITESVYDESAGTNSTSSTTTTYTLKTGSTQQNSTGTNLTETTTIEANIPAEITLGVISMLYTKYQDGVVDAIAANYASRSSGDTRDAYNRYNTAVNNLVNAVYGTGNTFNKDNAMYLNDIGWILAKEQGGAREFQTGTTFQNIKDIYIMDCLFNEYGEPAYGWVDTADPTENADSKVQWYTNLFNRMKEGFSVLENGLASSNEWIQFALESGLVTMEQVDSTNLWKSTIYSNCSDITEVTDDVAVARAEAEYNKAMKNIENKDQRYDIELKNIDTEHNSLQTEYDSVKSVIDKNIERSFKIYS